MRLQDQVAIVTGGSRGIGRAIARAFAAEGAKVAVIYKGRKDAADKLVQEVNQAGGAAQALQADVADSQAATQCVDKVLADWGRIDILVNSAGIIKDGLFVRMEPEDWKAVIDTNLCGTINFCKAVLEQMVFKQRKGRIINLSSVAATRHNAGQANYAASKGGIESFTRSLAVEIAARGVTVNAIAPGFIETDMTEAVRNKAGDVIKKAIPLRRLGQPEDIAKAAVFLASEDSAYITGQVLTVDGGLSLGASAG